MLRRSLAAGVALALSLAVCRAGDDPASGLAGPSPFIAGCFLVAKAEIKNSPFERAVVLILRHDGAGTLGLVVNRKTAQQAGPFPVFDGGPCPAPGPLMLHGQPEWLGRSPEQWKREVAPGICMGDDADWNRAAEASGPARQRVRVFFGFAGWAPGQLERERAAGAWTLVPASGRLLFDTPVENLWDRLSRPSPSAKVE